MRALRTPLAALLGVAALLLILFGVAPFETSAPGGSVQPPAGMGPAGIEPARLEQPRNEQAHIAQVRIVQLPPEARATLLLIERGGPFPYRKDGTVFGNRERLLPLHSHGYYREYTVPTPGSRDRGARRIVAGSQGEHYYTSDHYRSFRRIIR